MRCGIGSHAALRVCTINCASYMPGRTGTTTDSTINMIVVCEGEKVLYDLARFALSVDVAACVQTLYQSIVRLTRTRAPQQLPSRATLLWCKVVSLFRGFAVSLRSRAMAPAPTTAATEPKAKKSKTGEGSRTKHIVRRLY